MLRYEETRLVFDPLEENPHTSDMFITHAHFDHAKGFDFPVGTRYSTKETREIYEVYTGREIGNWQQVRYGRRLKVGQVEVEAHDAGHVLGAAQYEIITPEGNVVYTGHINFTDTLLTRAAEVAPCDLLVVDTSLISPSQFVPARESVIADMVKWTLDCIKDRRIPALEADVIGIAQELVRIFNTWTELPVIVHPRITKVNRIYETNGIGLRYADASTEEASDILQDSRCVIIIPRRTDMSRYGNFKTAYVSAWATRFQDPDRKVFPLNDRADFNQLLRYVEEARPRIVLTCLGGKTSELFAQMVSKRFGVSARPLVSEVTRTAPSSAKVDEGRVARCQGVLLQFMQTPNFTYEKNDLMALGLNKGFKIVEVEQALLRLTSSGALKYSKVIDGYRLV